jgi:hypothetical protein
MTQEEIAIPEILEYARSYMDDYPCSDRLRFCVMGDPDSESDYLEIRSRGCCGFIDYVKYPFLVGGKAIYFGFNYGH